MTTGRQDWPLNGGGPTSSLFTERIYFKKIEKNCLDLTSAHTPYIYLVQNLMNDLLLQMENIDIVRILPGILKKSLL